MNYVKEHGEYPILVWKEWRPNSTGSLLVVYTLGNLNTVYNLSHHTTNTVMLGMDESCIGKISRLTKVKILKNKDQVLIRNIRRETL